MNNKQLCGGIFLCLLILTAGCYGEVEKNSGVTLESVETKVETKGDKAIWTWKANIGHDKNSGLSNNICDIKMNATLYDKNGEIIANKLSVIKHVPQNDKTATIQYIGDIKEINNIVNYDISVSEPRC